VIRDFVPLDQMITYLGGLPARLQPLWPARQQVQGAHQDPRPRTGQGRIPRQVEEEFAHLLTQGIEPPLAELERIKALSSPPGLRDRPRTTLDRSDPDFALWVDRNTVAHKQPGYIIANISLKPVGGIPGDASADQIRLMADLARLFSFDELRVTHAQNIVLPHVRKADLYTLWQKLDAAGLANANLDLIGDIIACPGLDYCSLANARSIPVAQKISERFAAWKQDEIGELKLKISGCINACGHHHAGHIGILGVDRKGVENYQLLLRRQRGRGYVARHRSPAPASTRTAWSMPWKRRPTSILPAQAGRTLPRYLPPHRHGPVQGGDLCQVETAKLSRPSAIDEPVADPAVTVDASANNPTPPPSGSNRATTRACCCRISTVSKLVEVNFPTFGDGRGYSAARILREAWLRGRIARGGRCAGRSARTCAAAVSTASRPQQPLAQKPLPKAFATLARRLPKAVDGRPADLGQAAPRLKAQRRTDWTTPAMDRSVTRNLDRKIDLIDTGPRFTEADAIRLNRICSGAPTRRTCCQRCCA
jgi:hypothetical protein